jgi:hypothetical protein
MIVLFISSVKEVQTLHEKRVWSSKARRLKCEKDRPRSNTRDDLRIEEWRRSDENERLVADG